MAIDEPELGTGGQVGHQVLVGVGDDLDWTTEPRLTVPGRRRVRMRDGAVAEHLTPHDHVAERPSIEHGTKLEPTV